MKLTAKQEAFAQAIAGGMNQSDAYRANYRAEKCTDKTIWERASALAADSKVAARLNELKAELTAKELWKREDSVRVLVGLINSSDAKPTDVVSSVKELNVMHGYHAPAKVESTNTTTVTLGFVPGLEERIKAAKIKMPI